MQDETDDGDHGGPDSGRSLELRTESGGGSTNTRAATPAPPSQRNRYADGTYTAIGRYGGQPSFITVKATLSKGTITALEVTPHATVPRSLELQRLFAAAVPRVVVGKPIDQVNVGKLAGSSGTPKGFNAAIRQIRDQAAR
ncbi:hypothetical protein ACD578_15585 [Microvirga sp. RSM25]|uniref:hypothetical protein n=1 Tax=Microvirga sp. RSM25 TaxID=3273802 RepID=UPI00384D3E4F